MSERRFTAQEMREAASTCETVEVADQFYAVELDRAAAMLRYAAGMVERCEKERANYIYSTGCGGLVQNVVTASAVGLIDRIVFGVNGEEEK